MNIRNLNIIFLHKLLLYISFFYLFNIGLTWNGVTDSHLAQLNILNLFFILFTWIFFRTQISAKWHVTQLDAVFIVWLATFLISTLANLSQVDRITQGLWFTYLYILCWYVVQDLLSNNIINKETLIDVLVMVSFPVIITSVIDFFSSNGGRLSGNLENPNNLGGWIVLLLPIVIARSAVAISYFKYCLRLLVLLLLIILFFTESRGAILGVMASVCFLIFIKHKALIIRISVVLAFALVFSLLFNIRQDSGRIPIYANTLDAIFEKPLVGHGIFTFRIEGYTGILPGGSNLYPHNFVLHVAFEFGLLGLFALTISIIKVIRARVKTVSNKYELAAFSAMVGCGIHQLLDFPLMMPNLALMFFIVLSVALPISKAPSNINLAPFIIFLSISLIGLGVSIGHLQSL